MAVQEDEFTGEDDEALRGVAVEGLVAAVEQLYQFAGVAAGGSVIQFAGGVEGNAGLGGVRNDEANLWLVGQCHVGLVLSVGVQTAADDVDTLQRVDGLAVLTTLQVHVVQAVLTIQPLNHTLSQRLYDDDRTIEVSLLVHVPDNPINKGAQEISFTELNNFLGHHALRREVFV